MHRPGVIEGQVVTDILLDTGSSRSLVRQELVSDETLLQGESVAIRCAHGDTVFYPVAELEVEIGGRKMTVKAAVSETLPMSMLVGTDVPQLIGLLQEELQPEPVTRAQAECQRSARGGPRRKLYNARSSPVLCLEHWRNQVPWNWRKMCQQGKRSTSLRILDL